MKYQFRHPKSGKQVFVTVAGTAYPEFDEQYDLVVCHYTGALIPRREAAIFGAVVPQATNGYLCHPLANEARNMSVRLFQAGERNCNTCIHLERVPFDRKKWMPYGLMPGKCRNENREPMYPKGGDDILFAPDDCMQQSCYEGRNR